MNSRYNDVNRPDDADAEELREKLRDYYGTAMVNGFPMAVADLGNVDSMDDEEVIREAEKNGIR